MSLLLSGRVVGLTVVAEVLQTTLTTAVRVGLTAVAGDTGDAASAVSRV